MLHSIRVWEELAHLDYLGCLIAFLKGVWCRGGVKLNLPLGKCVKKTPPHAGIHKTDDRLLIYFLGNQRSTSLLSSSRLSRKDFAVALDSARATSNSTVRLCSLSFSARSLSTSVGTLAISGLHFWFV